MSVLSIGATARELLSKGKANEAIVLLERHSSEYGDSAESLFLLGVAQGMLGQFEKVVVLNDRALALAPDLTDAHFNRALALLKLARYPEARAGFRRVIALNPRYPKAVEAFQHADLVAHRDEGRIIRLGAGFSLCVPSALQLMTTYIA